MKQMIGGCCVCADENGWPSNPLVYCDGHGCDVAVHQGCYGILKVPEGEWFCAKCSRASKAEMANIRCALCPSSSGALKQTDNGKWAHVICALYIPEVQFGDVHSMDPVIISRVPDDRYTKMLCCLCEERGDERQALVGACMECNRLGCKKSFHVTCAQYEGLLCEEGSGSNVKYCGYCPVHVKKMQNDPMVKMVPPFRSTKNRSVLNRGGVVRQDGFLGRFNGPPVNGGGDHSAPPRPPNCFAAVVPSPPPPNSRQQNGPKDEQRAAASPPPPNGVPTLPPHPLVVAAAVASLPVVMTAALAATTSTLSAVAPRVSTGKRGRPPGSGAHRADGTLRPKRPRKNPKRTVRTLLELVDPIIQDTVSDVQRDRVQQQEASSMLSPHVSGPYLFAAPQPVAFAPMTSQHMLEGSLPSIVALAESTASTSLTGVPVKPTPKIGLLSPDASASTSQQCAQTLPASLEQLLERQWEQGAQFLIDQAQHFDIASLLSCLHQLKVENQRLEESILTLAGRRDHLLAVNARLSLALNQNPSQSPHHSPHGRVNSAGAPLQDVSVVSGAHSSARTLPMPPQDSSGVLSHGRNYPASATVSASSQASVKASSVHNNCGMLVSPAARGGGASIGSASGVFTSVARPSAATPKQNNASPERFLMARTATPQNHLAAAAYSGLSQEHVLQLQLLQQQQVAAAYGLVAPPPPPQSPSKQN